MALDPRRLGFVLRLPVGLGVVLEGDGGEEADEAAGEGEAARDPHSLVPGSPAEVPSFAGSKPATSPSPLPSLSESHHEALRSTPAVLPHSDDHSLAGHEDDVPIH